MSPIRLPRFAAVSMLAALELIAMLPARPAAVATAAVKPASGATRKATPKAPAYTLEHALTLSSFSDLAWSRDGSKLAYVVAAVDTAENAVNNDLWLYDFAKRREWRLTRHAKSDGAPAWSPSGDTLAFIANRGSGDDAKAAVWMLSLSGGDPWEFGKYDDAVTEIAWSPDGARLAFVQQDTLPKLVREWRRKKWDHEVEDRIASWPQVWLIDVATQKKERLTADSTAKWHLRWSPDGRSLAWITSPTGRPDASNDQDIAVLDVASRARRVLGVIGDAFAWSPDARWIALATGTNRASQVQKTHLLAVPAAGGAPRVLTTTFDEDAYFPAWSAGSDTLFFHSAQNVTSQLAAVPLAGGPVRLLVDRRGSAGAMTPGPGGRVAWVQSHADRPAEISFASHPALDGAVLTARNAETAKLPFGTTRAVRWTSSDGVTVEGLLLRPPGADPNAALRTAVLLHGGPYGTRYDLGFQALPQWLAVNGWQILMPNFRSSSGYGTKFMLRQRADWGGQDWRDVTAGVDQLVAWGLADSARLAVYGGSYGGYLSAWAVTQTRRFDAACVIAGISDLRLQWGISDIHRYRAYDMQGTPWEKPDVHTERSPITHVAQVVTPTLILVGESDRRTPIANSELFYTALMTRGVPVELVRYPREGHGVREYRHRWDYWTRTRAWFERWVR